MMTNAAFASGLSKKRSFLPGARKRQKMLAVVLVLSPWLSLAWISPAVSMQRARHQLNSTKEEPSPALVTHQSSPLSLTLDELSTSLGGTGRARACWECFRLGVDPVWYFGNAQEVEDGMECLNGHKRKDLQSLIPSCLGRQALKLLQGFPGIEENVASLVHVSTSSDGTTKLLLRLVEDGLEVETVIIPMSNRKKSTLCISSQVGCRQGCTFCSTGRMGKLRSLSCDEILAQVFWANKACRLNRIYPVDNVVFMGMGEPADNGDAVVRAAHSLVDRQLFQLANKRVTISTVGPTPESFAHLGAANVSLAWSVHASRDSVRKLLVPTTKYTMDELRQGLIDALLMGQSKRARNVMLEITMLDGINDNEEDAMHLVEFCRVILDQVPGLKLVVNLIPWNDIGSTSGLPMTLRQSPMDRILTFQSVLMENGIFCYIRTTRGDDKNAACGQLATSKKRLQEANI